MTDLLSEGPDGVSLMSYLKSTFTQVRQARAQIEGLVRSTLESLTLPPTMPRKRPCLMPNISQCPLTLAVLCDVMCGLTGVGQLQGAHEDAGA